MGEIRLLIRQIKVFFDERPCLGKRQMAIFFAERVMKKSGENMVFLVGRTEFFIKLLDRLLVHHPIAARYQELRGRGNRCGIFDQPFRSLIQLQQDIDCNRPGDQRVALIGGDARRVVRQKLGFDIRINKAIRLNFLLQSEQTSREWHIQLDLERGRRQHQTTYVRRVVMHPRGRNNRPHALCHHRHVFYCNAVSLVEMAHKTIGIF